MSTAAAATATADDLPSSNDWLFDHEDLRWTPSRADGIGFETEMYERAKGVDLIVRVGSVRVNVPLLTVATASLFLHRFYMLNSIKQYPAREVAMACLFLAGKVEESLRKVEAVVNYCLRLEDRRKGKEPDVHPSSEPFKKLVAQVLYLEEVILVSLQFDLTVTHPHPLLSEIVSDYSSCNGLSESQTTSLMRCSWQILTDVYTTPLCVMHTPSILAAATLLMAHNVIESLPTLNAAHMAAALKSKTTGADWSDPSTPPSSFQEIGSIAKYMASWWQKARNEVFRMEGRSIEEDVSRAVSALSAAFADGGSQLPGTTAAETAPVDVTLPVDQAMADVPPAEYQGPPTPL